MEKNRRVFRTLGDTPKIITNIGSNTTKVILHNTNLFNPEMLVEPDVRMGEACSICQTAHGKYKTKNGEHFCSVNCFKKIAA